MADRSSRRKVARIREQYEFDDLDRQLKTGYTEEGRSLRDLADTVNKRITRMVLDEKPFSPVHVYEMLRERDSNVTKRERAALRRRLRLEDIDVEAMEHDWVSHMAVRSYLRNDLGIDTDRKQSSAIEPDVALDRIRRLVAREESIVWNNLAALDGFDPARWDLHTDMVLIDSENGESVRVADFLREMRETE